jgi:hypothetical protein
MLVRPYHHKLAPPPGHCLPPSADLDLVQLSLLHQFSTSTSGSFVTDATDSPRLKVWREHVPRLAFSHPAVLHAIFAVSALHLAFLNPTEGCRYQLIAADHCQKASVSLRQTLASGGRDSEVGSASFVTSALIAICSFADPGMRSHGAVPCALTWIPILRGVQTVVNTYREPIRESPLGAVLRVEKHFVSDTTSKKWFQPGLELPEDLDGLHLTEPDNREAAIYAEAIQNLREAWTFSKNTKFHISSAFQWPIRVSEEYLELLKMKKPRALALLAVYYCALFPNLEGLWWNRLMVMEDFKIIRDMIIVRDDETWTCTRLLEEAGRLWTNRSGTVS